MLRSTTKKQNPSKVILPKDVWGIVIQYLDPKSTFRLKRVAKAFVGLSPYTLHPLHF